MKTALLFGMTLAGSVLLTTLSACKKETIAPASTRQAVVSNPSVRNGYAERLADIVFTGSAGYACGSIAPCSVGVYVPVRRNMVTLNKTTTTASIYPNLRYTFYKQINATTYTPIAQYICSSSSIRYANSLLPDNTNIYVIANLPSSPAPSSSYDLIFNGGFLTNNPGTWGTWGEFMITTQDHNGDPC